ncbi:MAG: hypothetical protein RLZ32_1824 [Gemmatimonadota bacterium]|jgi:uncharacterized DUF497 family protein
MTPTFEWNQAKAAGNVRKHGIRFEEARTVFEDEEALLIPDPIHSVGEERFVLLGLSAASRVLVVVHCERADGEVIRIISARKADPGERATYMARRTP